MKHIVYILFFASLFACAQGKTKNTKHNTKPNKMTVNAITDPETIVTGLIDAMQSNDAAKIRSSFSENASQAYGDGAAKSGTAFFSWLASDIIDRKGHVENAKYSVTGNQVVVTGQYSSVGYTNKANFLFEVENGQITSWRMRY